MSSDLRPSGPPPEDDPTGMRALLGSLPDPGPMPPDLAQRIAASIVAEQAAMDQHVRNPVVTPLVRRRPLWQRAGLVAAGLLVIGIAGSTASGTSPSDLAARLMPGSSNDSAATVAEDSAAGGGDSGGDVGGAPVPMSEPKTSYERGLSLADAATASGTAYTSVALATQAAATVSRWMTGSAPDSDQTTGATTAPVATAEGLQDCLLALSVAPMSLVGADLATLDGQQAAIVVVRGGEGTQAYAVRPDCRSGAPGVLAGPVTLP